MATVKKIVLVIAAFLLGTIVLDRALNLILESFYKQCLVGQTGGKINYYLKKVNQPDVLIMGDSRAFYMLNPDSFKIKSGFNISHAGMDQCFQNGLLSILIHQQKMPSHVLLHIEPDFYMTSSGDKIISKGIQQLKFYYGTDPVVTEYLNELGPFESLKYELKSYRFNGRVINTALNYLSTQVNPDATGNGFIPRPVTKQDSLHTEFTARNYPDGPMIFNTSATRYLLQFIQIAKLNNIRVDCFTSPVYFKRKIDFYQPAQAYLDSLFAAHQIRYIDYERHYPSDPRLRDPHFWEDSEHLNGAGAALFSAQLAKDFGF